MLVSRAAKSACCRQGGVNSCGHSSPKWHHFLRLPWSLIMLPDKSQLSYTRYWSKFSGNRGTFLKKLYSRNLSLWCPFKNLFCRCMGWISKQIPTIKSILWWGNLFLLVFIGELGPKEILTFKFCLLYIRISLLYPFIPLFHYRVHDFR